MEFTRIILGILLRCAPAQALTWLVAYLIDWAIGTLEDEDNLLWIEESPRNAQWFGGWLAFTEMILDGLILLMAWKGLNRRWPGREIPPWQGRPLQSVRTLPDCLDRLTLIAERFADRDRLASRRREKLARLFEAQDPLGRIDHRPAEAAPVAARLVVAPFFFPPFFQRPFLRSASARRLSRVKSRDSNPLQPAAITCEIAPACAKA